jgi:iron complex transport system substrate-binding protein
MRIACLLPAATEIACLLGLRDRLVGRSHECDFPPDVAELPTLTASRVDSSLSSGELDAQVRQVFGQGLPLYDLDSARLAELRPDVIVTQQACEVCAVSYDQVRESVTRACLASTVLALEPTRLGHVWDDVRRVARACGVADEGQRVAAGLEARLRALAARADGRTRPRVALIEWLAPPMLAGHWAPELLHAAGAEPLGPRPGETSPYATWDEIAALRPDALIVAPCGFDLERTRAEARPLAETLRALAPRVLLMDGNAYVNRPGPRLVEAAETIAAFLRGEPLSAERACALA